MDTARSTTAARSFVRCGVKGATSQWDSGLPNHRLTPIFVCEEHSGPGLIFGPCAPRKPRPCCCCCSGFPSYSLGRRFWKMNWKIRRGQGKILIELKKQEHRSKKTVGGRSTDTKATVKRSTVCVNGRCMPIVMLVSSTPKCFFCLYFLILYTSFLTFLAPTIQPFHVFVAR
jgi:hypothetical protein